MKGEVFMNDRTKTAIDYMKKGGMVIIYDSDDREAEGDFAFAGKFCDDEKVNFMIKNGGGLICMSISTEKAQELGISRQVSNGKDKYGTPFGNPINAVTLSSGISAKDRSETILSASSNDANQNDFYFPGHVHTLIAHPDGLKAREGHTEAILDLISIANIGGPGVLCEILNEKGDTANYVELEEMSKKYDLPLVSISEIKEYI
jgi:3,4-dihydroxy 2-butanone 4-phosphate synthase/GTP cyclohydrolase II